MFAILFMSGAHMTPLTLYNIITKRQKQTFSVTLAATMHPKSEISI